MRLAMLAAAALAVLFNIGQVAAADGKAVYDKVCGACHNIMSPKLGNKADWEPRVKMGSDALMASVLKGKGAMPPKGGVASLSDADIKAAVEYIVSQVK